MFWKTLVVFFLIISSVTTVFVSSPIPKHYNVWQFLAYRFINFFLDLQESNDIYIMECWWCFSIMKSNGELLLVLGFRHTFAGVNLLHLFHFLGAIRTQVYEVYGFFWCVVVACVRAAAQPRVFTAAAVTETDVFTSGTHTPIFISQLGEVSYRRTCWWFVFTSPGLQKSEALGEFTGLSLHGALVLVSLDHVAHETTDGFLTETGAVRTDTHTRFTYLAWIVARCWFACAC